MVVRLAIAFVAFLVPTAISLWRIADDHGQHKAETFQRLQRMRERLDDHEGRLRGVERFMLR